MFVIKRKDTGEYLGRRSYGNATWTRDLQEARTFHNRSPASNAYVAAFKENKWSQSPTCTPERVHVEVMLKEV